MSLVNIQIIEDQKISKNLDCVFWVNQKILFSKSDISCFGFVSGIKKYLVFNPQSPFPYSYSNTSMLGYMNLCFSMKW